jgi:hypothetical protein
MFLHFLTIVLSCLLYFSTFFTSNDEKMRGVNWVGSSKISEESLNSLDRIHANWIIQTPFAWQRDYNKPDLILHTSGRILWGESDEGIRETTRLAKEKKLKTMLKPHIWLKSYRNGKWRSDIRMESEEDWKQWFKNYENVIIHYAKLAEELKIEALCIGTELYRTAVEKEEYWLEIIKKIRSVYSGKLTYAANWYREYEELKFWDKLDYIGIQAYFPLGEKTDPSISELNMEWEKYNHIMQKLSDSLSKKIIFTELGYKNMLGSTVEPWVWPQHIDEHQINEDIQDKAFKSFFQSCWKQDWLAGIFIWKWFPHEERVHKDKLDFSPQKKKVEGTIREWFHKEL